MTSIEKLTELFERFPGIGPRQARRFVHHLLTERKENVNELSRIINQIQDTVSECQSCFRFYAKNGNESICNICSDPKRDTSSLMVVERDADIIPIEKSGTYDGFYFVLGGTIPLLESEDTKKLRGNALKAIVEKRMDEGLKEIILAFSVNPDGENTARYVMSLLEPITKDKGVNISSLGRGLSTGSELEYADPETIKNALRNRS